MLGVVVWLNYKVYSRHTDISYIAADCMAIAIVTWLSSYFLYMHNCICMARDIECLHVWSLYSFYLYNLLDDKLKSIFV